MGGTVIRVSGGAIRGRRILTPGDAIRPTQEKIRQALFSCLASQVPGCRFLDLFAGSGSVGLEAWSRGAGCVFWVERDPRIASVLKRNVAALCVPTPGAGLQAECMGGTRVVTGDAVRFVENAATDAPFDIIYADPPYARGQRDAWPKKILQAVMGGSTLGPKGVLVIEQGADEPRLEYEGWAPTRERVYGGTLLRFWEK